MAIKLKTEEERRLEKEAKKPKTKLQKAHKIFFIISIVFAVILLLYFIGSFAQGFIIAPLAIFWLSLVIIPTAVTAGIVWASEGYRNFVISVSQLLANAIESSAKIAEVLLKSLPYVGSVALAVIGTYAVLSFLNLNKNKEDKRYFTHFIMSVILFGLTLIFVIVSFVLLPKVGK